MNNGPPLASVLPLPTKRPVPVHQIRIVSLPFADTHFSGNLTDCASESDHLSMSSFETSLRHLDSLDISNSSVIGRRSNNTILLTAVNWVRLVVSHNDLIVVLHLELNWMKPCSLNWDDQNERSRVGIPSIVLITLRRHVSR